MLKILSFPRPLQHRFEIKKEVFKSGDEENTKSSTQEYAHIHEEAPKTEETGSKLPSCLERIRSRGPAKARRVVEYTKQKLFLLMCDEPLIRTEVCLNIFKICASKKTYVLRCLLGQNQLVPDFFDLVPTTFLRLCGLAIIRILYTVDTPYVDNIPYVDTFLTL